MEMKSQHAQSADQKGKTKCQDNEPCQISLIFLILAQSVTSEKSSVAKLS